jgi:ATP-dependent DNA helicase PIF1
LIDWVFLKLDDNKTDSNYITSWAILSTKNDCADRINMKMINKFQGDERVYHSFNEVVDDLNNYYPSEFLNTLMPNGLPPHVLKLKKNCPVILLRNIDPVNGLCNST